MSDTALSRLSLSLFEPITTYIATHHGLSVSTHDAQSEVHGHGQAKLCTCHATHPRKTPIWARGPTVLRPPPRASTQSTRCATRASLVHLGRTDKCTSPAGQPEGSHALRAAVHLSVSPFPLPVSGIKCLFRLGVWATVASYRSFMFFSTLSRAPTSSHEKHSWTLL